MLISPEDGTWSRILIGVSVVVIGGVCEYH